MVTGLHGRPRASVIASVIATLTVVLASCGPTPSATPSISPTLPPGPTSSPAGPTPVPSPTIEPVTPTSDQVILRMKVGDDITGPRLGLVLYADGSLLDLRSGTPTVMRLSASGSTTVRQRLRSSGLFYKTHAIPSREAPMGFGIYELTFVERGKTVTVSGTGLAKGAEARRFLALVEGLQDLVRWLPATAFVDGDTQAHPYLAESTRVTSEVTTLRASDWTNAAQSIERVSWPLATPPDQLGDPVPVAQAGRTLRCGVITGTEESAIRSALAAFESDSPGPRPLPDERTTRWYVWLPAPSLLVLTLHPFLPDEQAACDGPDLPPPPDLAMAPRPTLHALLEASAGGLTPQPSKPILVVREGRTADGVELAHVTYYADGTILFYDPPVPAVGIGARRLSAAGLAAVQQALDGSGLTRPPYQERVPDGDPAYTYFTILIVGSGEIYGTDLGRDPKEANIIDLTRKLLEPTTWLPVEAWAAGSGAIRPYRPASIQLTVERMPTTLDPSIPPLAGLTWPLGGRPETFGQPVEGEDARTGPVAVDDALALMRALELARARLQGGVTGVEYWLGDRGAGTLVKFRLEIVSDDFGI